MRVPAVCLVLLVVALSGCSALPGGQPPSDDRALAVRNQTAAAVESVSTYRFSLDADVHASSGDETRSLAIAGEGTVDRRQRRAVTNMTADGTTRSSYIDGRTVYTECPSLWDGWGVENASESTEWSTLTPLGRQVQLLERSTVYWGGNRTVDGNRTAVLVAKPSKQTLTSLREEGPSANDFSADSIDNVTLRMWVDARTNLPVRSTLRVELSTRDASAVATLTTRFHGYDDPASVSIPASTRTDRYELGCPGA